MGRPLSGRSPNGARSDPGMPPLHKRHFGRAFARCFLLQHFKVECFGRENLPKSGAAVVLSNHPTYWDPWIISFVARRWITYMAWAEAFEWPFIGWTMKQLGAIPLSTERPTPSSMRAAYQVIADGRLLGIFPEGARTAQGTGFLLDPPRPGAARIALKTGVPVVPVSIAGARRLWLPDQKLPRRGPVRVCFHPPIDPKAYPDGPMREREALLLDQVARTIRSALPLNGRHRFAPSA